MKKLVFMVLLLISHQVLASDVRFVANLPVPGEYTLEGQGDIWYVGKDHAWVVEMPPVKTNGYGKIYIGAMLGKGKTDVQVRKRLSADESYEGNISNGPYNIYIGISFEVDDKPEPILLTTTDKIPPECSFDNGIERGDGAKWFWVEIDRKIVSTAFPYYVHIWTENEELNDINTAPVVASGMEFNGGKSFLVEDYRAGNIIEIGKMVPAIAVKMVKNSLPEPDISITNIYQIPEDKNKVVFDVRTDGEYITEVGVQLLNSDKKWVNVGYPVTKTPYGFILDMKDYNDGNYGVRCWVKNWYELTSFTPMQTFYLDRDD